MKLTLHQLEILLAITKNGSFSRAAEEVHISQPAVSAHVKDMESKLGVPLFERVRGGVHLTTAGRVLAEQAQKAIIAVEEGETAIEEIRGLAAGTLTVGGSSTPGTYLLPRILGRFKSQHPGVDVRLRIGDTRRVVEWVLQADVDVGVVGQQIESDNIRVILLCRDELVAILPPNHALSKMKSVTWKSLERCPLILREVGSSTREVALQAAATFGVFPEILMELGNIEAIKEAVAAGLGVSIVSTFCVSEEAGNERFAVRPIAPDPPTREITAVIRRAARVSPSAKSFLAMLPEQCRELT